MRLNKIHVYLHQVGIDTKQYKKYCSRIQNKLDANLFYRAIEPALISGIWDPEERRMLEEYFWLECSWFYRENNISPYEAILATLEEYVRK